MLRGKSLLPSGVITVEGDFERGEPVDLVGPGGQTFARGLVTYSATELRRLAGRKSADIESLLGYRDLDEAVHRDDTALLEVLYDIAPLAPPKPPSPRPACTRAVILAMPSPAGGQDVTVSAPSRPEAGARRALRSPPATGPSSPAAPAAGRPVEVSPDAAPPVAPAPCGCSRSPWASSASTWTSADSCCSRWG